MPVNGDVDGQAGCLQEVGQQVPRDDPRLGDAHLNIMTQRFDLATSSWEDERDEQESLVGEFNIASRLLDLLLAVTTLLIKACCKPAPKSQPAKVQRSKLSNFPLEQFAWRIYDCQAHSMEQLVPCIS